MSLISFNAPDNSHILEAINCKLNDINENAMLMKYSLGQIQNELTRIADSAEIIAGTKSKEEVVALKMIERLESETDWAFGEFGEYEHLPKHSRDEIDEKVEKLERLRKYVQYLREKEIDDTVKLCEEEK